MKINETALFKGVTDQDAQRMLDCFDAKFKAFSSGKIMYSYCDGKNSVGVLTKGSAIMERIDEDGTRTILEQLEVGSVFGEVIAFASAACSGISVISETPCEAVFIDYEHITKRCSNACVHHSMVVQNMLRLVADKAMSLSDRVDVLTHRSIRGKLVRYFEVTAMQHNSQSFVMPFSLAGLADYICVDRSAMMRELKKLRDSGYVEIKGKNVVLL